MATSKSSHQSTRAHARDAARSAEAVRDRVRELSVRLLRDRSLSGSDVTEFVQDVFDGALEGVDASVPRSGRNVLREVFDGLREGVHALASAGSATAGDLRKHGSSLLDKDVPAATKRIRAANDELLGAVEHFAGKASKDVREELDSLVARAKRTAPKVTGALRDAKDAADGRWGELAGETVRAGLDATRRGASALAMGAGGLLEGLADAVAPRRPASAPRASVSKPAPKKEAPRKKAAKKSPARKGPVKGPAKKASKKGRKS